jgi:hypothetical protein
MAKYSNKIALHTVEKSKILKNSNTKAKENEK